MRRAAKENCQITASPGDFAVWSLLTDRGGGRAISAADGFALLCARKDWFRGNLRWLWGIGMVRVNRRSETLAMRGALVGIGLLVCGGAAAERFQSNALVLEDITGRVEIITNNGDEIDITVEQGKQYSQVKSVLGADGTLTVSGEAWDEPHHHNEPCCNFRVNRTVNARRNRVLSQTSEPLDDFFADYPTIKITMPRNADVTFKHGRLRITMDDLSGALRMNNCYAYGEVGDAEEAVIDLIDGSRLVVGDIGAGFELDTSGAVDVLVGNAAIADLDIAGQGDVVMGAVDGIFDVSIAGSGAVRAARVDAPAVVRIAGSGSVAIQSGRSDRLRTTIDGSGTVLFDGVIEDAELRLFGSSEVRLRSLSGSMKHYGDGDVYVDGEKVEQPRRRARNAAQQSEETTN